MSRNKKMVFKTKTKIICVICKKDGNVSHIRDYWQSGEKLSLHECRNCKVQFFFPLKNPGSQWYESTSDYSIKDITTPKIYRGFHRAFLKRYGNLKKGSHLLELGCGAGEFINEVRKMGLEVFGVDFDRKAIDVARKYFHLKNVFAMPFNDFFKKTDLPKFDYIVFFEVIEHLDNPLEFIESVKKNLRADGKIFLSTPSRERTLANWDKWDFPPHHLTRWNKEAIANLFSKIGFVMSDFCYVEQFKIILGAIDGKFRSGLVAGVAGNSIEGKKSPMVAKTLYLLAKIKMYLIGFIPAFFLWIFGKLTGRNNGIIFAEFHEK